MRDIHGRDLRVSATEGRWRASNLAPKMGRFPRKDPYLSVGCESVGVTENMSQTNLLTSSSRAWRGGREPHQPERSTPLLRVIVLREEPLGDRIRVYARG